MNSVEVVVIGGSLAGAACVRELTRLGVEAVAFERDTFPREKVCGGFLSPGAVESLKQLDVLQAVRNAGAIEVNSARVRTQGREMNLQFSRPGLGVSRSVLDATLGDHEAVKPGFVRGVRRVGGRFLVDVDDREVSARVVVDAAGKLSRLTQRQVADEFGVQFYEPETRGDVMDFWFFGNGYGGAVSVEGNRSNACFLIKKDALPHCLGKPDCRVTGPLSYRKVSSDFIAVGDAAGMVDPFCGEGMHHALDTGIIAARIVANGLRSGRHYDDMRLAYEDARFRRWGAKRLLARTMRALLPYAACTNAGMMQRIISRFWL